MDSSTENRQLLCGIKDWLIGQRHCCLRLVTSLLFTTCYVIVVYDLLRHCCLRLVTSLLFTTCYVIVVYDLLRHCCLRLVTSLLFTTCYVIVVYDLLRHCNWYWQNLHIKCKL